MVLGISLLALAVMLLFLGVGVSLLVYRRKFKATRRNIILGVLLPVLLALFGVSAGEGLSLLSQAGGPPPSLAVAVSASPASRLLEGQSLTIAIWVTNKNGINVGTAKAVVLDASLPGRYASDWVVISQPEQGPCRIEGGPGNQRLSCSLHDLQPGTVLSLAIQTGTTVDLSDRNPTSLIVTVTATPIDGNAALGTASIDVSSPVVYEPPIGTDLLSSGSTRTFFPDQGVTPGHLTIAVGPINPATDLPQSMTIYETANPRSTCGPVVVPPIGAPLGNHIYEKLFAPAATYVVGIEAFSPAGLRIDAASEPPLANPPGPCATVFAASLTQALTTR